MKLNKRDNELLNGLSKYGMFSTKQIVELYFKGTDSATVLRRLRLVEVENYLRRVGKLETNEVLWGVTSKGGEHSGAEHFKTHWSKSMNISANNFTFHYESAFTLCLLFKISRLFKINLTDW